jgi:hypothetical protein
MRPALLTIILSVVSLGSHVYGQNCSPPPIVANAKTENIFTPEQEMILGDLTMQRRGDLRFIDDAELLRFLEAIGTRLIKHLPETGLRFHFHLVDIPEVNAFNSPGGHVFVSRKLIGFVKNEDELAAVIAHELGHATVHHSAADFSVRLKKVLGVGSVGDRKDISDKYNLLIENARKKRVATSTNHEGDQQLEADRIGMFALVEAGYDGTAFGKFFDRLADTKGKTGNWFTDLFGKTSPDQKRLREMVQFTDKLPAACKDGRSSSVSQDFLSWQANVISYRPGNRQESLPGLIWKKELAPKLRSDVSRIIVGRTGRFIVVQDDFAVTVLQREPLSVLFSVPVDDAKDVYLSPDERELIFSTNGLRMERWSIVDKKPTEVRELTPVRNCLENKLSPDGRYLTCVDMSLGIRLIDTRTSEDVYHKGTFYELNYYEYLRWLFSGFDNDDLDRLFRIEYSPDGKYVLVSRSNYFRVYSRTVGSERVSYDALHIVDLTTLKPVGSGGDLKSVTSRAYAFLDPQRILGSPSSDAAESGIFSFPDGKRLAKFPFMAGVVRPTADPSYLIVKPLQHTKMGVFDTRTNTLVAGSNKIDADIWGNKFIYESVTGKLVITEITGDGKALSLDEKVVGSVELPAVAIRGMLAAQVSDNFRWLALSSRTRGGMWDMATGARTLYSTGYRGAVVSDDGSAVGEFPEWDTDKHALALLDSSHNQVGVIRELPHAGARQYGRFVLRRTSLEKAPPSTEKKDSEKPTSPVFFDNDPSLRSNVRFELVDFVQDKVIWSRDFPKDSPQYSFDSYSGRLVFYWRLSSDAAKAKLIEFPDLKAHADQLESKDSDWLLEVVDAFAGKEVARVIIDTGKGSFYLTGALSEANWLVVYDSQDRVLVYDTRTGELRHRFFGGRAAINPVRNQIAVENYPGEVTVFNLETGDQDAQFVINGGAEFLRFDLAGTRLFVLSDQQNAYAFDLTKAKSAVVHE